MVLECDVNCVYLRLQYGEDLRRFPWLTEPVDCKLAVSLFETSRTILFVSPVAYRVKSSIKIARKRVYLAVRQLQAVFEQKLVIGGGNLLAGRKRQSDSISNEAIF